MAIVRPAVRMVPVLGVVWGLAKAPTMINVTAVIRMTEDIITSNQKIRFTSCCGLLNPLPSAILTKNKYESGTIA